MHNLIEEEWEEKYFAEYPYTVEIFNNECVEDIYRTDEFCNAQAKFDEWQKDLEDENIEIKMFKYDVNADYHKQIDYNGKIIEV